jgi:hypothetical protein
MTRTTFVLLLIAACGGHAAPPLASHPGASPAVGRAGAPALAEATDESIGGIARGMTAAAVVQLLGAPSEKGEITELGATGEFVANWSWKATGVLLTLTAATPAGAQTVGAITIWAPCALKTSRGVGIGTSRAEVERRYHAFLGTGRQDGEPDMTSAESLIIGSIYGGTFFSFVDGKVSQIFVGAGAE